MTGFRQPFRFRTRGQQNQSGRPNSGVNISGNLHLTRKDHHCKYSFQFVTAEAHKWRLHGIQQLTDYQPVLARTLWLLKDN